MNPSQPPPLPPSSPPALPKVSAWPAFLMVALATVTMIPEVGMLFGPWLLGTVFRTVAAQGRDGKHRRAWWLGVLVGVVVFLPAWSIVVQQGFAKSMDSARNVICLTHLHSLETSIQIYSETHHLAPWNLQVLVSEGLIDRGALTCPSTCSEPPTIDYFYYPLAWGEKDHRLVVCDLSPHKRGIRCVLFSSSNMDMPKTLTAKEFAAELARPENADFATGFRAAAENHSPVGK